MNGQIASDDRDVISDDPCLKCRCSGGKMICSKQACPVLQCPQSRQHHPPGECCPRCKGTRALMGIKNTCTLQTAFFREGATYNIDRCTNCTCRNDTSICTRASCPILDCAPELQKSVPGSCCKKCIMPEEVRSQCFYKGTLYEASNKTSLSLHKSVVTRKRFNTKKNVLHGPPHISYG
ncbi:hypothetical protein NQ318_001517 [Aromia moschata]|uniref:VWFC domain-containing protein n=1 Tax=Aromia moschata TaxID=1265417 RepID=A0AAV8Y788_9CUCU|nr:hypothetical protein NQ318_001517 [Aromia moschata]